jgi:ubiquinone/menaquinone biosynthesis C-methylase UbiE
MVNRGSSLDCSADYQVQYDEYWALEERIGESSGDLEQTAEQIIMACGLGPTLDIGSGEGQLVVALLRRGVDAQGIDVSEVVVSRCNQRTPGRFVQGSVLALPFEDNAFQTLVSTDCMEHLTPEDIPTALKEMYRVTSRYVFLKLATTQDRDAHWHLTVEGRGWWEAKCFEAGFRKHFSYYRINPYESLNQDGWQIVIPLEKIPVDAFLQFPLNALKEERDLHMDMLREHGSRSDAHVSRYQFACKYIRPGDTVVDAACGLGYGSYLIHRMTKCATVTGFDGSAYGVKYAESNFGSVNSVRFVQGYLPECLKSIEGNSVDSVICFETLEHVESPLTLLAEFNRILTPGGRLFVSVPHDWSDETGKDPNPFHFHVYNRSKFISELTQYFQIEHFLGQTADRVKKSDASCEWLLRPRSFDVFDPQDENITIEAEWLLAVACKTPLQGESVPYIEKVFSQEERAASGNALAFARDYLNPWLIRSLVSIGLRTENSTLRVHWANEILSFAPEKSSDYGAAICILAYYELTNPTKNRQINLEEQINSYIGINPVTNPNVFRWQVSLSHVQGLIALAQGHRDDAKLCFRRVIDYPVVTYSPTLLTKPAEAAYLLGLLYAAEDRLNEAEAIWTTAVSNTIKDIGQHFSSACKELSAGFELREIVTALSIMGRLVAAIRYVQKVNYQPSVFYDEVNEDFVSQLFWLTSQRAAWERTAAERDQSITALQQQVQDLLTGNEWLTSQRAAWEQTAAERDQSITALQQQVQDLLTGNEWLTSQRAAWEQTAAERDQSITALQQQVQDLLTGNEWLTSQRAAWEQTAAERDQSITALQQQVQDLLTGNEWLTSQRDAWEQLVTEREKSILTLNTQNQKLVVGSEWLTTQCEVWEQIAAQREQIIVELRLLLDESGKCLAEQDAKLNNIRSHWGMRFVNFLFKKRFF